MTTKKQDRMEKAKKLILEGHTNREIADALGIALSSVGLYKHEMRAAGIELPEFKYGRPSMPRSSQDGSGSSHIHHKHASGNSFTLVVNGSAINIPGGADVVINPTGDIEVNIK